MAEYNRMRVLDVWYAHIDLEDLIATIKDVQARKRIAETIGDGSRA